jgi:G3E family GTPase
MRAEVVIAPIAGQQACFDGWLDRHPAGRRTVVVENSFAALEGPEDVPVIRLAAGCVCCVGQVPLRVALVRAVRAHRPQDLLLLLATAEHLPRVRALLSDGSLGVRFTVE